MNVLFSEGGGNGLSPRTQVNTLDLAVEYLLSPTYCSWNVENCGIQQQIN